MLKVGSSSPTSKASAHCCILRGVWVYLSLFSSAFVTTQPERLSRAQPTDPALPTGPRSASAPSYALHSPISGSSGTGVWHRILIPRNKRPQDAPSDPGSGGRASEAPGHSGRVSFLRIRSREGERPGTRASRLLMTGGTPALTQSLCIIPLPCRTPLTLPRRATDRLGPEPLDCHAAYSLLLISDCHSLQWPLATGESGGTPTADPRGRASPCMWGPSLILKLQRVHQDPRGAFKPGAGLHCRTRICISN